MSEILLLNNKTKVTFYKWPSFEERKKVIDTYPMLRTVEFDGVVVPDFSMLESFSRFNLVFDNCQILDYGYPICLDSQTIYFENTRMNFEKFFFMTDMPNIEVLYLLYDSVEGVMQFKPYIHLLRFFPTLRRLRLLMVINEALYYDMDHTRVFGEDDYCVSNISVMYEAKLRENMDFVNYLLDFPKSDDGVKQLFNMNFDLWRANRRFWVNPKFKDFYNNLKKHDLKNVREFLKKFELYGPLVKDRIGRDVMWPDFSTNPIDSYVNLETVITGMLRCARLGSGTIQENDEPEYSSLFGLFDRKLYNTNGHYILVNSRGSIISDYYEEGRGKSRKLVNNLLPF